MRLRRRHARLLKCQTDALIAGASVLRNEPATLQRRVFQQSRQELIAGERYRSIFKRVDCHTAVQSARISHFKPVVVHVDSDGRPERLVGIKG